ncbi:MAG: SatD family protein [Verrucomicrobiota bacterium]
MEWKTIFMGDITNSRGLPSPKKAQAELHTLVTSANKRHQSLIESPLTITLGDEFQGVIAGFNEALEILFAMEEQVLRTHPSFTLHYVIYVGRIDSKIARERAHGMLGPGLTSAREILTSKKRDRPRYQFGTANEKMRRPRQGLTVPGQREMKNMSRLFSVIASLQERWNPKDHPLIADMIHSTSDTELVNGTRGRKDRSQIRKRRQTLLIEDYRALKELALDLSHG